MPFPFNVHSGTYIIVSGDPHEGFSHTGPFNNENEAKAFASNDELTISKEHWWVVELIDPAKVYDAEIHNTGEGLFE